MTLESPKTLPPLSIEHGGFLIQYCEAQNHWRSSRAEGELEPQPTLEKARRAIDRLGKQEKSAFKRHTAYLKDGYSDRYWKEVLISSYGVKTTYSGRPVLCAWATDRSKKRSYETLSDLREMSPENSAAIEEIDRLRGEAEKLTQRIAKLSGSLTPYRTRTREELFGAGNVPEELVGHIPK